MARAFVVSALGCAAGAVLGAFNGSFAARAWAEHYTEANAAYLAGFLIPWALMGAAIGWFTAPKDP